MNQSARSEVESGEHRDESDPVVEPANDRGLHSGAFTKQGAAISFGALRTQPPPPPAAAFKVRTLAANTQDALLQPPSERAEIRLSDLRLELENPFFGSSLLPPAKKKRAWLKPLLASVAGCALLAAGYTGAVYQRTVPVEVPRAAVQPVAPAQPRIRAPEVAATPEAVAPAPVVGSAVEVAQPAAPVKASETRANAKATRSAKRATASKTRAPLAAAEPPAPEHAAETRAEKLTRAQVLTGLEGARAALTTCAAGGHGTMMASVTISGAGRITHATVEGAFAGTPQGSCMARALRTAQFPATTTPSLRVRYPFVF